jgi:hypothetical protein
MHILSATQIHRKIPAIFLNLRLKRGSNLVYCSETFYSNIVIHNLKKLESYPFFADFLLSMAVAPPWIRHCRGSSPRSIPRPATYHATSSKRQIACTTSAAAAAASFITLQ